MATPYKTLIYITIQPLNNLRIWYTIHSIQFISSIFKIDYRQHEYSRHLLCSAVVTSSNATRFTFAVRSLRQHSWCTQYQLQCTTTRLLNIFIIFLVCNTSQQNVGTDQQVSITLIISCLYYFILHATDQSLSPIKFIRKYKVMFRIIKTSQNVLTAVVFERVCIMVYANSLLFFIL